MNTYVAFLEDISPVKSGNLKRSWNLVEIEPLVYLITNEAEYAEFNDSGTGIYATTGPDTNYAPLPGRKPITPKKKQALSFKIGGTKIVVRSVKGIKPLKMIMKVKTSKKLEDDFGRGLIELIEKHIFKNK